MASDYMYTKFPLMNLSDQKLLVDKILPDFNLWAAAEFDQKSGDTIYLIYQVPFVLAKTHTWTSVEMHDKYRNSLNEIRARIVELMKAETEIAEKANSKLPAVQYDPNVLKQLAEAGIKSHLYDRMRTEMEKSLAEMSAKFAKDKQRTIFDDKLNQTLSKRCNADPISFSEIYAAMDATQTSLFRQRAAFVATQATMTEAQRESAIEDIGNVDTEWAALDKANEEAHKFVAAAADKIIEAKAADRNAFTKELGGKKTIYDLGMVQKRWAAKRKATEAMEKQIQKEVQAAEAELTQASWDPDLFSKLLSKRIIHAETQAAHKWLKALEDYAQDAKRKAQDMEKKPKAAFESKALDTVTKRFDALLTSDEEKDQNNFPGTPQPAPVAAVSLAQDLKDTEESESEENAKPSVPAPAQNNRNAIVIPQGVAPPLL